jgi:hypothetical protein
VKGAGQPVHRQLNEVRIIKLTAQYEPHGVPQLVQEEGSFDSDGTETHIHYRQNL